MEPFYAVIDLEKLADKLAPLLADRLGTEPPWNDAKPSERKPAANEPDDWPAEPADDPWGDEDQHQEERGHTGRSTGRSGNSSRNTSRSRDGASQARSGSSRGNSGRSGQRSSGGRGGSRQGGSDVPESGQHEDRVGKLWEFGLSDAPECDHGMPAAEVTKPGARWRAWACPLGFGKDYKNKCDLWEYQD